MAVGSWNRAFAGLITISVAMCVVIHAQDHHDQSALPTPLISAFGQSHSGSSPFAPPTKNDQTFWVDSGTGLDTGCTYKSGGPLIITLLVDRVVGTKDIPTLKANGLISSTATLTMPAYDVDSSAQVSGINPEQDVVWFNDHVVPSQYLTGLNDTWVMNTFYVPIEWVHFPKDPGKDKTLTKEINTIRIDIDTANTADDWCTSVDWAALSIQVARPVVLVHGIFSSGGTWDPQWVNGLTSLGLPFSNALNMGDLDSISNNATKIAGEVSADQLRWGVDAVNLVGHSKGGIDSREFLDSHNSAENLIQIGTPNKGSPLADFAEGALVAASSLLGGGISGAIAANQLAGGPAGIELTQPYMSLYNLFHGQNHSVKYTTLAGYYHPDCSTDVEDCALGVLAGASLHELLTLTPDPNDTIVPVSSAQSLPYSTHLLYETSGTNGQARHACLTHEDYFCQTSSSVIFNGLVGLLEMYGTPINSNARMESLHMQSTSINAQAQRERARTLSAITQGSSGATALVRTVSKPNRIRQAEVQTGSIAIDSASSVTFLLLYPSGTLDFSLTAPSGVVYTSASSVNNPNVTYGNDLILGGKMAAYTITAPETGVWTYKVTGTTVTDASGMTGYSVDAWLSGTTTQIKGSFGNGNLHLGDALQLTASITTGNTPFSGATVTATILLPDKTTANVTLHDDGTNGDAVKNDGIYTGSFAQTSQAGNYQVVFQAKSTSPAFEREDFQLATVSSSKSAFSGVFSNAGVDSDSDGLFNVLKVTAGVNITKSATYRVIGTLTDSKGNSIESAVQAALSSSNSSIQLSFDGTTLYQNGVDGPYQLSRITMAEIGDVSIMPVDEKLGAYQTAAYKANEFQHTALAATGNGTSRGIDLNGNKLFDQLVIDFDVTSVGSGSYNWSGRLSDKNGTAIGLASNSGNLIAGVNTIELVFDGSSIGKHGVNGPYMLNDMLLYGTAGSLSVPHVLSTTAYTASQFEGFTAINRIATGVGLTLTAPASGAPVFGDNVSITALILPTTGTGVPTGTATFTVDGANQPATSMVNGRATLTIAPSGGKHVIAANYSGDTDYVASASSSFNVTVSQAATSTVLTLSSGTITYQDTSTLTAAITSSAKGTITGVVTFSKVNSDRTLTSLGTSPVTKDVSGNFVATLTGQSFAIGGYTVVANYAGDSNYSPSASTNITLTVTDKADLTLNVPSDISLTSGGSSTPSISLSPVNGFSDPITLTCGGMPSGVTCSIVVSGTATPDTVTIRPDSSGAYPATIQLKIASSASASLNAGKAGSAFLVILLPCLFGPFLFPFGRRWSRFKGCFIPFGLIVILVAMTGCSGGGGGGKTSPKISTGTLALSSSGTHPINHTYTFTVTVM